MERGGRSPGAPGAMDGYTVTRAVLFGESGNPQKMATFSSSGHIDTHRIHGAAIYGNMDPINIPQSC